MTRPVHDVCLLSLKRRGAIRMRRHRLRWIVTCGIIACLVGLGTIATAMISPLIDPRAMEDECATAAASNDARRSSIEELTRGLAECKRRVAVVEHISARADWSRLLSAVSSMCQSHAVLTSCRLERTQLTPEAAPPPATQAASSAPRYSYHLIIEGVSPTHSDVSALVLRFEQAGASAFENVTRVQSGATTLNGHDAVTFQIRCDLAGAMQ